MQILIHYFIGVVLLTLLIILDAMRVKPSYTRCTLPFDKVNSLFRGHFDGKSDSDY